MLTSSDPQAQLYDRQVSQLRRVARHNPSGFALKSLPMLQELILLGLAQLNSGHPEFTKPLTSLVILAGVPFSRDCSNEELTNAKPSKRSMILGVNTKARDLVGDSGGALSPEHLKKIQAHKEKLRAEDEARINEIKERLRREGHSEKDVEARFSNPFHESVTVNDLLDLRSTYMQADEKEQEALIEQMLIELDRICQQVASRHGIAAGDMIMDKDGCWDEDPLSLVPDIVKMGWDFVHTGDVEVHNETSDGGDMYATAIRLFSIANALVETEHADVLCGLGISISDIGYHDKAIELLETSRHLAPNNHITLLYLGMVYFENEQLEEAAEILEPAIRYCAKACASSIHPASTRSAASRS